MNSAEQETLDKLDTILEEPEVIEQDKPYDPNVSPLDDIEDNEPIFIGGPTKLEVNALKVKYPHSSLMALLLADGSGVLYRTMSRNDWRVVQNLVRKIEDVDKREEIIFSKVVLYPDCSDQTVVGNLPAGVITSVMQEFYVYSGFQTTTSSLKL